MVFYQIVERKDSIRKAKKTVYIIFTITHYIVT